MIPPIVSIFAEVIDPTSVKAITFEVNFMIDIDKPEIRVDEVISDLRRAILRDVQDAVATSKAQL